MTRLLSLLALVSLAACGSEPADVAPDVSALPPEGVVAGDHGSSAPTEATTYTCAEGGTFTLTPQGDGSTAEIALPDQTVTLSRTESSMGVRYGEGAIEVWIADDGAFVAQDSSMTLVDCTKATGV